MSDAPFMVAGTLPAPQAVSDVVSYCEELTREHGPGLALRTHAGVHVIYRPGVHDPFTCWCITCEDQIRDALADVFVPASFIVCPDCGNKRCPRASHHDLACTRSNEPGQPGSVYTGAPPTHPVV